MGSEAVRPDSVTDGPESRRNDRPDAGDRPETTGRSGANGSIGLGVVEPGAAEPGIAASGDVEPGDVEPGTGEPGDVEPGERGSRAGEEAAGGSGAGDCGGNGRASAPGITAAGSGEGWSWFASSGEGEPDVAQAVCVDGDVRTINLAALRPVAAAHPYPLLFSTVAGAHLYGFPARDSDVDLRGAHLLPAVQVVGLRHGPQTVERTWLHDEVRLDLVTYDVGKFFRLLLRHNGQVLEQLLSPLVVTSGPVHAELVALALGCLTRKLADHYRSLANSQWELYGQTGELKPLLYTFRALLTGIHVVRTGELVMHLPSLLELVAGPPPYVASLIEAKAAGEQKAGDAVPERLPGDVASLRAELELAEGDSPLPDHPSAEGALHDLLVRLRLEGTSAWSA